MSFLEDGLDAHVASVVQRSVHSLVDRVEVGFADALDGFAVCEGEEFAGPGFERLGLLAERMYAWGRRGVHQ